MNFECEYLKFGYSLNENWKLHHQSVKTSLGVYGFSMCHSRLWIWPINTLLGQPGSSFQVEIGKKLEVSWIRCDALVTSRCQWSGLFLGVQEHVSWWACVDGFTSQNPPPWGQSCMLIYCVSKWFSLPILDQCIRNSINKISRIRTICNIHCFKIFPASAPPQQKFANSEALPDQALVCFGPKLSMQSVWKWEVLLSMPNSDTLWVEHWRRIHRPQGTAGQIFTKNILWQMIICERGSWRIFGNASITIAQWRRAWDLTNLGYLQVPSLIPAENPSTQINMDLSK